MQKMRWLAILSALVLILSCFFTWATIASKGITISGVAAEGTAFGKPGYMHILVGSISILLLLINSILTARITIFLAAFNAAWAIRNFVLIPTCYGGVCPSKHIALYVILVSSVLFLLTTISIRVPQRNNDNS